MTQARIDAEMFRRMVARAAAVLEQHKEDINALNVFPVPDGDTGANMSMTMRSAALEVAKLDADSVGKLAQALAQGSLMGARGNSGVILSQLFRGFAHYCEGRADLSAGDLAQALQDGVDTAYRAVMKPVEGTILTVAKEAARAAARAAGQDTDVVKVLERTVAEAEYALARTPDLLPVLKKAGVVDSGGKGYCCILSGYLAALSGDEAGAAAVAKIGAPALQPAGHDVSPATRVAFTIDAEISHIEFPYDTEFFVRGEQIPVEKIRASLYGMGDSVLVVGDASMCKVHIHTANPGPVLDLCVQHGELLDINILNMREQHEGLRQAAEADAADADADVPGSQVVSVAAGEGFAAIFKSLGVHAVIEGGQTMNPSTQDILAAIETCRAPVVFVLPNNKNIIMAAQQAAELAEGKTVHVIPTRSVPEGVSAAMAWQPGEDIAQIHDGMQRALDAVQTGEITFAVRDSNFDGLSIKEGDILGIWNGLVSVAGRDPGQVLIELVARMVGRHGGDIITLYYGIDVGADEAAALAATLRTAYPDHEVDVHSGGQPLYFYLIALE